MTKPIKKMEFSRREIRDLIISVIALGFLFSFSGGFLPVEFPWVYNFLAACLVVGLAFIVHELAHRFVARRYECKSEYILFPQFLLMSVLITVVSALLTNGAGTIVFAAPGYVAISTRYKTRLGYRWINLSRKEMGEIAWSGPLAGIAFALFLKLIQGFSPLLITYMIQINLILAAFNLLPIPPLDGSKVMAWNPIAWLASISISALLIFLLPIVDIFTTVLIIIGAAVVIFLAMQRFVPQPV